MLVAIVLFIISISYAILLTLFLDFCFRRKHIFHFWLPFVASCWYWFRGKKKIDLAEQYTKSDYESFRDYYIDKAYWVTYPLGACIGCFGFWVAVFTLYPFMVYLNVFLSFMGFESWVILTADPFVYLFGILIVNFFVRLFYGKLL